MKKFNLINTISGWLVFAIASSVYLLTMEPTVSFWDCGEFIATSYKLEVGHPPGAPFFMIVARFFSLFASDPTKVAMMVNTMSALCSGLTIMFLFWSLTHITRRMLIKSEEFLTDKMILVFGSSLVGALAYTFSDTFWFSAVEAEVYASSSLFTALVFWAILKWEEVADQKHANRWIVLIAYLMGLSIGVHLLNLLAIPAIVFVFYFKKYETTKKGIIYASLLSIAILATVMYGIINGLIVLASKFELAFVNSFGLGFNSGVIFYAVLLIGLLIFGIWYSHKKEKVILNTILIFFMMIMIGYSSFTMIVIRSLTNTPIDENNPDNVFALLSYLNREQYGDRPLLYGEYYNAVTTDSEKGKPTYIKKDDKEGKGVKDYYEPIYYREEPVFDNRFLTIFPRMYSRQDIHVDAYKQWGKVKGIPVQVTNHEGETETLYRPTFFENLRYFFSYQLSFMYFRYFMWNFAGRQNDIQGHGGILNGNWISGINFFDDIRLGSQENLPEHMKHNKARNTYFFLPFLLGIAGLIYHYSKDKHYFWVVMLLFFFTGIAIVVYLNQTPYQPRERDYAYAGSFYAFTIWIGIGVIAVYRAIQKIIGESYSKSIIAATLATIISLFSVPVLLASQNWDDHDRSDRYTARDIARNYLETCKPNSILFTFGDNDTFPLWYVQEVEGFRTDVRVCNLSLLGTDWYIDQMKTKVYESNPLPVSMTSDKYLPGNREQIFLLEKFKEYTDLKQIMEFVASDDPQTKYRYTDDVLLTFMPSKKLSIPVDIKKVIENETVKPEQKNQVDSFIRWRLARNSILKNEMMVLDILSSFDWNIPIYFAITSSTESYLDLENYFQLEGFAYRFIPIKTPVEDNQIGRIDTKILYDNLMNKFKWGNYNKPGVYLEENNLRTLNVVGVKNSFARLADALFEEGKKDSAIAVLDRAVEAMPDETVPFDYFMIPIIRSYYLCGENEKANKIVSVLAKRYGSELMYYSSLNKYLQSLVEHEQKLANQVVQVCINITDLFEQKELHQQFIDQYGKYVIQTKPKKK